MVHLIKYCRVVYDRLIEMTGRTAINAVFGSNQKVQRCCAHKLRNVLDYLPKDDKPKVKSRLRATWKLEADKGIARIKQLAVWLDEKYLQAAAC